LYDATPMIQDFFFKGDISNLSSIEKHRFQMIQFINQFFSTNTTAIEIHLHFQPYSVV
jgi:hypothetical protein